MINVSLDLGRAPSVLAALANPVNQQRAANAMAQSYVDDMLDWIASGQSFTPRQGGGLEQSINWHPAGNGSADVYANKDYAGFVEHGTGVHAGHTPWTIHPKDGRKALKIPVPGGQGYVLRRSVIHPGSRPFPFFFADQTRRNTNMISAARTVLAAHWGGF